jgi:hypothetical protein
MKKKRHTPEQIIKKLQAVENITGQGNASPHSCLPQSIAPVGVWPSHRDELPYADRPVQEMVVG